MELTVLGSGGCMAIPKPLCTCRVCVEARLKRGVFARTGPSAFLHDENILIDTPAEIAWQLNQSNIKSVDYLILTHLDPDHTEGFRVVEQITLDFRSWLAYPEKTIELLIPEDLIERMKQISTAYGSQIDFFKKSGFIKLTSFNETIRIGKINITALPVSRGEQTSYVYVFEDSRNKIVYAPCDIKPFPENEIQVQNADILLIQPGIIEGNLKHGFTYPENHISRTTLYTLEETIELSQRINASKIVFIHLEEYWNLSFSDYCSIQNEYDNIEFAYDGMEITC
jgi:phosphoribosyl 1,2-cyclic phosphate phosphodiesterase